FFKNITLEVRDALHRMRHHASLGLICGNNEMEWAFEQWDFPKTKENRVEYIKQYEVLFPALVAEVCPEIDYWPASPSSGGHFDNPNDYNRGDVHDWNVWHGRKNYTEFRKNTYRFLSEFGFQSFPNIKTVKTYTEVGDRNIFSPVMEDHQRNESDNGNSKIFHFIADYYRYPKDFESILYTSQLSQAEALRYAVEHLRQNRGRCMGTTYWQLNDNWPTASWSSIDYFGRWKAMHYSAKRCYDPVLVSVKETGKTAEIHVTNDRRTASFGTINWKLLTLSGEILRSGKAEVEVAPLKSSLIESLDFSAELADLLVRDRYLAVEYSDKSDGVSRSCSTCFVPYKQMNLAQPQLKSTIKEGHGVWEIRVKAETSFAKFVELDLAQGDVVFSDNYFDIAAGQERLVTVAQSAITQGELLEQLRLRSLIDSYS
ncbi:MAG: glycoside hydrolase family 2 protein, partial [Proteobacteria bacterium]|nr:glycoside hydrolase family 2 protein [Pseudomonadota bacterium]